MKRKDIARIVILSAIMLGFSAGGSYADIQWLPKYQEKLTSQKRVSDTTNPTFYNPASCEAMGWLSEVPANQSCSPKYMPGGIECWSDCKCKPQYVYAPGKGVANGCPNGQTVNTDACGGLYSGCVDCSTNTQVSAGWGTTYKSGSNVAVMTNFGTCANYYYSCNTGYKPAAAAANAFLHAGGWQTITCADNQKAVNQDGTDAETSPKLCQKCIPKVCADYNAGYVTANDPTMACAQVPTSEVGGLSCWNCVACGSEYQYTTSNCPSPKILGTDLCNGKASTCSCPATVTCGTGITCKTQAPSGCSGCIECNTCPNSGTLSVCPAGYACAYEECSRKYYITGCATGNVNIAKNTWYGCWMNKLAK